MVSIESKVEISMSGGIENLRPVIFDLAENLGFVLFNCMSNKLSPRDISSEYSANESYE